MEEKRTIELEIKDNFKKVEKDIDDLNKSLKDTGKEFDNAATFAQRYGDELQPLTTRMGEAEDRLYELAAAGDYTSNEYKNLLNTVGEYRRVQINTDLAVDAASMTLSQKLGGALGGVASGFELAQGSMALFGVESENVQEALLKVQSAMALSQGLQGLKEAKSSFIALGDSAKKTAVGQSILTAATKAYTFVTSASTTGLKLFRIALISTGIGALVVGVGLLVANFDKVVGVVKSVVGWFGGLSGTVKNILSVMFPFIGVIRLVIAGLEAMGIIDNEQEQIKKKNHENDMKRADAELKKQAEIRKARDKAFEREQNNYDRAIKLAQAEGKSVYELQKAKLLSSLKQQEAKYREIDAELKLMRLLAEQAKFIDAISGGALSARVDELDKLLDASSNEIENQKNDLKILEIEKNKPAAGTGGGTSGGTTNTKENIDITRRIEDERLRIIGESRSKELAALDLQYKRKKEDAEKELANDKDKVSKLAALNAQAVESKKVDEQKINDKYDQIDKEKRIKAAEEKLKLEDEQWYALQKLKNSQKEQELLDLQIAYDKEFELAGTNAELQKALTDKFNKDSAAINKKYRDEEEIAKAEADKKEADRIIALNDLRFKAAKDTLETISNVTELFAGKSKTQQKKAFQVQKAVSIAGATMDTYKAAASALKDSPAPFNYIAMAAVITAGLLNVKKIASQKFEGGGSSGGGGGTGGGGTAPITPQFNTVGNNGINQLAQLQQQPVQAYVVSGEVTSQQSLDRNRAQNSSL